MVAARERRVANQAALSQRKPQREENYDGDNEDFHNERAPIRLVPEE
jgi:hypothetical protein